MSVRVPTGPTGALGGVGIRAAVLVLVAAVAAGALAAYAPVPGVLLAVALVSGQHCRLLVDLHSLLNLQRKIARQFFMACEEDELLALLHPRLARHLVLDSDILVAL